MEMQWFVLHLFSICTSEQNFIFFDFIKVVDPWGKIIAKCDNNNDVDVAVVDIDLDIAAKVRKNMPCFEHRRNEIYSLSVTPEKLQPTTADFVFEKYPIPNETIFYQSNHSLAFTNIRCVVPGRILFN